MRYSYGILKENYPELEREKTLLDCAYQTTKFVIIEKVVNSDSTENISRIIYSDCLLKLQKELKGYISWYDYVDMKMKNIQGYISEL